ncbi:response regulator [bacterium]|nr:response regulator [bacterium]MBU1994858.1 response regulator [bacterium]
MKKRTPLLIESQNIFIASKEEILSQWISYESPQKILKLHEIQREKFLNEYADAVFDYFMGVISGKTEIGYCPIMQSLLAYLNDRDIRADELFEICSHFRKSMIDFSYDAGINSKQIFDEISYIFDKNFAGILRYYTDTIFQKEQEIDRNVKLLSEYKKALDESALISKTDTNGYITYVNEKLVALCGFSESELIGQKHNVMRHEDMSSDYYENLWYELKQHSIYRGTIKNRKKNDEYFYIDVTIVRINDPHDNSTEYMSIAYDVTKLIDARLEALKAGQAKDFFLSNMSHEIRTPLNAILGFVNLLRYENVSKKHRNYLEIILSSGENLLSIINDILDFSKLRSGEFTIEPKVFSLHEELSHTMELFVASANNKNITITSFIDPKIPKELYADALRIKQILSNFLSNAIKFTPRNGVISVEASCKDKKLTISVRDNGIGVSVEDIKNIFTAFAQAQDSALTKSDGTGLGLSICHQLAHHMDGSVNVESVPGEGSRFWVEIPVEVYTQKCQVLDDVKEFINVKTVIYSKNKKTLFQHESLLKYANVFGMDVEIVDNLDADSQVLIFVHENADKEFIKKVVNSDKKYIALMSRLNDEYDKYPHIVPMCFPLYCSKIKATFSDLINPDFSSPYAEISGRKFIGHILIAEDNEANQELIKILLMKYGLSFDLATNGLEAVSLYENNNYDLILMDEQMPVMDGNESVQKILKYEKKKGLQHTPVAALTANVIKGAKERGLSSGFDSFLGKPIILKELERVFQTYLIESFETEVTVEEENTKQGKIEGLDAKKLADELMLNEEELVMLLSLFLKKMKIAIPELENAINEKDYKKIALIAHNVKGSSANFRMESVQQDANEIEKMAKNKNSNYDFESAFENIRKKVQEIKIS